MSQYLEMDPVKRDYIFSEGSPIPTDSIQEASYFSLLVPKNNWLYGESNQGSLLYKLDNTKRTGSIEQQFASYAEDAINQQLVSTGKATAVAVKNIQATRTGTRNQIEVIPNTAQTSSQFEFVSV